MDLQKEREAFEIQFRNTKQYISILHFIEMGAAGSHQDIHSVFQRCDFNEDEYAHSSVQSGWSMWQAAKAQAVPEGFVLVPIKPTETMVMAVVKEHEGDAFLPYSLYDAYVKQAMLEAQEPAND